MSTGKKGERVPSKGKEKVAFRWWGDWTILWIIGSFGLVYLIFVPLKAHLFHWLFSFLGGVAGYGIGLLVDAGLFSPVTRFVQRNSDRITLRRNRKKQVKRRR